MWVLLTNIAQTRSHAIITFGCRASRFEFGCSEVGNWHRWSRIHKTRTFVPPTEHWTAQRSLARRKEFAPFVVPFSNGRLLSQPRPHAGHLPVFCNFPRTSKITEVDGSYSLTFSTFQVPPAAIVRVHVFRNNLDIQSRPGPALLDMATPPMKITFCSLTGRKWPLTYRTLLEAIKSSALSSCPAPAPVDTLRRVGPIAAGRKNV